MNKKKVIKYVVIAILALSMIGALADRQKNMDDEVAKANNEGSSSQPTPSNQLPEESSEEKQTNVFHVGDIIETKTVKLTYHSCGEYQDDNMYVKAGEGNKLVCFDFEFENIGSSDASVGFFDFDCYADGYEAKVSMCTADNAMSSITTISPGRKTRGIVVFEVPQNAETIEVEYKTNYWTQDKAIFMYE